MGAATASGGGHVPKASFWVRMMTSCIFNTTNNNYNNHNNNNNNNNNI